MRWTALLLLSIGLLTGGCGDSFEGTPSGSGGSGAAGGGGNGGEAASAGGMGGAEPVGPGGGGSGGERPRCFDLDEDGVTDCDGDCDDNNPYVHPGAIEICGDGLDNACGINPDPEEICEGMGSYVSALTGSDDNPGTQALPLLTISEGIAHAVMFGTLQPVFVAEGTYPEDVGLSQAIDLLGGHQCDANSCSWQRDPEQYESVIDNQDLNGVYAAPTITRDTLVEGFTVQALGGDPGDSETTTALTLQGAPTIRGNQIVGGTIFDCSECASVAILSNGMAANMESVLLEDNVIVAGVAQTVSVAVAATEGGSVELIGNIINGAEADTTRAIYIDETAGFSRIVGNEVQAGNCAPGSNTFAIFINQGVAPEIDSNFINADSTSIPTCGMLSAPLWSGGIESAGSAAVIINNIVFGVDGDRSTAVLLDDCMGDGCMHGEVALLNNTLNGHGINANASISAALVFSTVMSGRNIFPARVRNNILDSGQGQLRYAGYEFAPPTSTTQPLEFDNNLLFAPNVLYRHWNGPALEQLLLTLADVSNNVNGADQNFEGDPMLDDTQHLQPGSPCIDNGTQLDLSTPMLDIDGDARPLGNQIDIGADETPS